MLSFYVQSRGRIICSIHEAKNTTTELCLRRYLHLVKDAFGCLLVSFGASWSALQIVTDGALGIPMGQVFLQGVVIMASFCSIPKPQARSKGVLPNLEPGTIAYYNCWKQHTCFFYKVDWPEVLITPDSSSNHVLTMLCHLPMICLLRTRGCESTFPSMELFSHVENEGVRKRQNSCPLPLCSRRYSDPVRSPLPLHYYTMLIRHIQYIQRDTLILYNCILHIVQTCFEHMLICKQILTYVHPWHT